MDKVLIKEIDDNYSAKLKRRCQTNKSTSNTEQAIAMLTVAFKELGMDKTSEALTDILSKGSKK